MAVAVQLALDFPGEKIKVQGPLEVPIDTFFPEEEASKLAWLESFNKHLYRPNTYLHKWWARRPGTTFRHILKQLVDDPARRGFYEPGGLEGKIILDPMMGGGTTLHEAIRMGASVVGIDVDPIPVLQTKTSLTLVSLAHKKAVFREFFESLRQRLAYLYQTKCPDCGSESEVQFVLYGLRRKCQCREVVFLDSLLLWENNEGQEVRICPKCRAVYRASTHPCRNDLPVVLIEKQERRCDSCGAPFVDLLEECYHDRYLPLVVVGACPKHRQFFKAVDKVDLSLIAEARALANDLDFGNREAFRVPQGPKSIDLTRRNITSFLELFTPRQLLYLAYSLALVADLNRDDRLWLSLLISTSLEFNSLLAGYKGASAYRAGAIRHVFSHHAYSFPYTALENNPIFSGETSGTLKRLFRDRILKAGQWAVAPVETKVEGKRQVKVRIPGEVDGGKPVQKSVLPVPRLGRDRLADKPGNVVEVFKELSRGQRRFWVVQSDARDFDVPENSIDYVVTDPPYYDSVQYSDLSNYFRVWLRLFVPEEANWSYDQLASAVVEGDRAREGKYAEILSGIWKMCFRALNKERGRLIFTFHHWRPQAWAELTISLKRANFVLANRYVVVSENPISVHIRQLRALKHDVILVLKPKTESVEAPVWPEVVRVDATDSLTFCRDCGAVLGWLLNSDYGEEQISRKWELLIGDNHAQTS